MLRKVDSSGRGTLDRLRKQPGKNFWLVFSTAIPDGETLFAIRFRSGRKGSLPESEEGGTRVVADSAQCAVAVEGSSGSAGRRGGGVGGQVGIAGGLWLGR